MVARPATATLLTDGTSTAQVTAQAAAQAAVQATVQVTAQVTQPKKVESSASNTSTSNSSTTSSHIASSKKVSLNFEQLGRRFELNAGSIRSAIASAVSEAAMRTGDDAIGKIFSIY